MRVVINFRFKTSAFEMLYYVIKKILDIISLNNSNNKNKLIIAVIKKWRQTVNTSEI